MLVKFLAVLFLVLQVTAQVQNNPSCQYYFQSGSDNSYTCLLTILNEEGLDNFTDITGTHLEGFNDGDVNILVFLGASANIPSIICQKFPNLGEMRAMNSGKREIGVNSLAGCRSLKRLYADSNQIDIIADGAFANNLDLTSIYLNGNQIKVVNSSWFGFHPNLTSLYIISNGVDAVDRRLFDVLPNLRNFIILGSTCAEDEIPHELTQCFDNFDRLFPEFSTSTTNPNECVINNLYDEVCNIGSEMRLMEDRIRDLERIVTGNENEINLLQDKVNELTEVNKDMLETLNKILERIG